MGSGVVSSATVKRDLARCRKAIFYGFGDRVSSARSQRRPAATEHFAAARVKRSSSSAFVSDEVVGSGGSLSDGEGGLNNPPERAQIRLLWQDLLKIELCRIFVKFLKIAISAFL